MYKRILVAVDLSPLSHKILDHAIAITENFGSEMKILAVVPNQLLYSYIPAGVYSQIVYFNDPVQILPIYTKFLADTEAKIRSNHPDLNVNTILLEGRPSVKIVEVAENELCDLIIMGSRRRDFILRLIEESTSHSVLNTSKIPILII